MGEPSNSIVIRCSLITRHLIEYVVYNGLKTVRCPSGIGTHITPLFLAEFLEGFCTYTPPPEQSLDNIVVQLSSEPKAKIEIFGAVSDIWEADKVIVDNGTSTSYNLAPSATYAPSIEEQLKNYKEWSSRNL